MGCFYLMTGVIGIGLTRRGGADTFYPRVVADDRYGRAWVAARRRRALHARGTP